MVGLAIKTKSTNNSIDIDNFNLENPGNFQCIVIFSLCGFPSAPLSDRRVTISVWFQIDAACNAFQIGRASCRERVCR